MVNFRVPDLDRLLKTLEGEGVWIDPRQESSEFGRFAWIMDCEGNRIELWEPPKAKRRAAKAAAKPGRNGQGKNGHARAASGNGTAKRKR